MDGCFYDFINLKEIQIPETVKWVGWGAFGNCKSLEKVVWPDTVSRCYSDLFVGCTSISEFKIHFTRGGSLPVQIIPYVESNNFTDRELAFILIYNSEKKWLNYLDKRIEEKNADGVFREVATIISSKDKLGKEKKNVENALDRFGNLLNESVKADVIAAFEKKNAGTKHNEDKNHNDDKKLTAAEMKKIWRCSELSDGTLSVYEYRGTELEPVIPERIGKKIITQLFLCDTKVTKFILSNNISKIAGTWHANTQKICVPETNPFFYNVGDFVIRKEDKNLVYCPDYVSGEIVIPDGVEIISASMPVKIDRISFPRSLKIIGDGVFRGSNIENLVLPPSLSIIGKDAFRDSSIENLVLPSSLSRIGDEAFSGCKRLAKVTVIRENENEI